MSLTASALIIGNEVLSGKVEERNISLLAKKLFEVGISFRKVVVCIDDIKTIADELNQLRKAHDYVFTSGGVGPTHDDVTLEAVAYAFGVPSETHPNLAEIIQRHFGERTTAHHLRMALTPQGAELIAGGPHRWPTVKMDNVYVLPGVPSIFEDRLNALLPLLDKGDRFYLTTLFIHGDEGEIAEALESTARHFQDVTIGSYLAFANDDHDIRLTFEGKNQSSIKAAAHLFINQINEKQLIRMIES